MFMYAFSKESAAFCTMGKMSINTKDAACLNGTTTRHRHFTALIYRSIKHTKGPMLSLSSFFCAKGYRGLVCAVLRGLPFNNSVIRCQRGRSTGCSTSYSSHPGCWRYVFYRWQRGLQLCRHQRHPGQPLLSHLRFGVTSVSLMPRSADFYPYLSTLKLEHDLLPGISPLSSKIFI